MDLAQLAQLGEFLGGSAVLVTLIYLALQVRHSIKLSQTQIHTDLLSLGHDAFNWKRDPQFAEIAVRADREYEALSAPEKEQYQAYLVQQLNVWEHAHSSYLRGQMTHSFWDAWDGHFRPQMERTSWKAVWASVKPGCAAEFRIHVDSLLDTTP